MNKANVKIIIFPKGLNLRRIKNYDENVYGKVFSDLSEIQANAVPSGYTVLYRDDLFQQMEIKSFGDNLVNLFTSNLPGEMIEFEIHYYYMEHFSSNTGISIIQLDDYFNDCEHEDVIYLESESTEYIIDHFDDDLQEFNFNDEDDPDDEDEDDDNDPEDDDDDDDEDDPEDDDDDDFPLDRYFPGYDDDDRKGKKREYGASKVMREASKVKRSIRRHGIVVCSDKDAIKRDKKILKAFLKDFVRTGDKKLDKKFRAELIERWMPMYTITKKQLKRLQKQHRAEHGKKNKKASISAETASSFARSLFKGSDIFYDPNK